MRRIFQAALALIMLTAPARGGGVAGDFDYFILSLSWSPNWCANEGAEKGDPQCAAGAGYGWVLHGLWPQYDEGWPNY
jgi:ribonuclease T2